MKLSLVGLLARKNDFCVVKNDPNVFKNITSKTSRQSLYKDIYYLPYNFSVNRMAFNGNIKKKLNSLSNYELLTRKNSNKNTLNFLEVNLGRLTIPD